MPLERDREQVKQIARELAQSIEPLLSDNCHGYRPGRSCVTAHAHVALLDGPITAFDIKSFFPSIDHRRMRRQLNRLDPNWWYRLWPWIPRNGLAMGVAFSPVLSNLYLNEIDHRFAQAVRYSDNIIVSGDPRPLTRQLEDLGLTVHEIEQPPLRWLGQPM
jgi:RNA-directed DNA polymerase